jgi:hypothetical protein
MNFFPDVYGYTCQSCDEPFMGILPGEISFVSAQYFPVPQSGHEKFVKYIGVRVISYGNERAAGTAFQEISAGFTVKGKLLQGTFYPDAYSSESWLWVLCGAAVIVCYAAHSATGTISGTDDGAGEIGNILMDVAHAIAGYTKSPE